MSLLTLTIPWLLFCSLVPSCFVDADHNLGEAKWTPAYDLLEEHEIRKDNLLTMLPIMTKEWRVCFDIKPLHYNHTGWANVLHLTIGGNLGEYGDNILKVGFNKKLGLAIRSAVNGNTNYVKYVQEELPPIGFWTRFEVKQEKEDSRYMFSVRIGNDKVWSVENSQPEEFANVLVYAGSPWNKPLAGIIKDCPPQAGLSPGIFRIIPFISLVLNKGSLMLSTIVILWLKCEI